MDTGNLPFSAEIGLGLYLCLSCRVVANQEQWPWQVRRHHDNSFKVEVELRPHSILISTGVYILEVCTHLHVCSHITLLSHTRADTHTHTNVCFRTGFVEAATFELGLRGGFLQRRREDRSF